MSEVELLARLLRHILMIAAAVIVIAAILNVFGFGRDDTDPPGKRSGLSLHTDHLTGCQYLATRGGGLTPRLDASGKHVGCRPPPPGDA